jgi:hypothetical protein
MASLNGFVSSDVVGPSIVLCPSFPSFESDISVESSSVASPLDDSSSETSAPSVPDEPVYPSFWTSPLPSPVSGELSVDESSVLPNFSEAGVICARASLGLSSVVFSNIVHSSKSPDNVLYLTY